MLSCQDAIVLSYHGCSHHPLWFGAQEEEICRCFHIFPFYSPWSNGVGCHRLRVLFCFVFNISVQFSPSVVSDSLWLHEPQHASPPCPSQTPGVHPNPCPSSRWCHPTISSSVIPFSSRLQCFPASGSFQMSQLFTSGGQSIGISASASVLPMNTQD